MPRHCYCSKILPGKVEVARAHYRKESELIGTELNSEQWDEVWQATGMTNFSSWLQTGPSGDYLIHCLEAEDLQRVFTVLPELITSGQPAAVRLHTFYRDVLGKDYSDPRVCPRLEKVVQRTFCENNRHEPLWRGFCYPLLPEKEEAHRRFCQEAMESRAERHAESCGIFGYATFEKWIQQTDQGLWLVMCAEVAEEQWDPVGAFEEIRDNPAWQEISVALQDHTGLSYDELNPQLEWLCKPVFRSVLS